jgi:RHS repeat-associated protein
MPGRNYINGSSYRYGMNGKEKDDEIVGSGNNYDFGARHYDPRLGRWLSLDPLMAKYPGLSPYNFCANNPIMFVDQDGRDFDYSIRDVKNKDGTVTRVVDVKVVYNVVNLSSKEINSGHFNTATAELSKGLDYTVLDETLKKAGVSSVEVNVEATFNIVSDFSKIKDNENVLLIVDKVTDGAESQAAGWGDKPGNTAIIEVDLTQGAGEKFAAATVHEVGHNLGFEHDESGKQAMNSVNGKNSKLTKNQQKEFDKKYMPAYKGKGGDSGHIGNGNSKAKAKEMLRIKGATYDHSKARKAKIE